MSLPAIQVPTLTATLSAPLPPVLNLNPEQRIPVNNKRFVIIHTVEIPEDDLTTFQSYGNVVNYDYAVEGNINIDNLLFDYLFIDLRNKQSRAYFDTSDLNNYNVICYISFVEEFDSYIENLGANNILCKFPPKQHYKASYDAALLVQNTDAPSKCLSCINYAGSFLGSLRKQGEKS